MELDFKRGIEDLRWYSLSSSEKYLVASLLEWTQTKSIRLPYLHIDFVIEQIRDQFEYKEKLPLLLTPNQNRRVAELLELCASEIEEKSAADKTDAFTRRTGNLFAGLIRSLVARLIKGKENQSADTETIVRILLNEHRMGVAIGEDGDGWISGINRKLEKLGCLKANFQPLFREFIGKAKQAMAEKPEVAKLTAEELAKRVEDEEMDDMDVLSASAETGEIARLTFDAAMETLKENDSTWSKFLHDLNTGNIKGLEKAQEHPDIIGAASNIAYTLAKLIRNHLEESGDLSREAVMPGLKSILDRYPGLKKREAVKNFVKYQLRSSPVAPEQQGN